MSARPMRVLLVANRSPWPPTNGATIRQYWILKALKARGHAVDVFAFADAAEADASQRRVLELADEALVLPFAPMAARLGAAGALVGGAPLSVGYYRSHRLHAAVRDCVARHRHAAAVVHSSNVADYVPPALRARALLDMADADSAKFADYARRAAGPMRLVHALEARRLRAYELASIRAFGCTSFVAEREPQALGGLAAETAAGKVAVIPNGVDTEHFRPDAHRPLDPERLPAGERAFFAPPGPRIVFTGVMDYPPNAEAAMEFAETILPRIRQRVPQARFLVVGNRPTPRVRALERLPGVTVTGFVDDARPYFTSADVYVLPLRIARGIQNKALEAMASGCAIVTTAAVADGLRTGGAAVRDGRELRVADAPEAFADEVVALLGDPPRRAALGAAARDFVVRHFSWHPMAARLAELVERCAAGRAGHAPATPSAPDAAAPARMAGQDH